MGLGEEEFYIISTDPELEFEYPKAYRFRNIRADMGKVVGFDFWRGITGLQRFLMPVLTESGEVHVLLVILGDAATAIKA